MKDLTHQEQTALDAVAKQFAATWTKTSTSGDVDITLAGTRVPVDVIALKHDDESAASIHLRFDKVATRVMERLRAFTGELVPDASTVIVTITAPIRLASKTVAAIEERIRILLDGDSSDQGVKATIRGNRVRLRLVRHGCKPAPKMIGFVHNVDSDAPVLVNMTCEWLECVCVPRRHGAGTKRAADRWLVLISAGGASHLQPCRHLASQLRAPMHVTKILIVFADGRVELLAQG